MSNDKYEVCVRPINVNNVDKDSISFSGGDYDTICEMLKSGGWSIEKETTMDNSSFTQTSAIKTANSLVFPSSSR